MKPNKLIIVAILAISSILGMQAQNTTSPYSKFGYGILSDNATSAQRSMGGVGYAMNSGRQINVMNPASYAAIDSLTFLFDMGLDLSMSWASENSTDGQKASGKNFGGGLDYITLQFPVTKYIGVSLGLLPYSSVGYSFGSEISNGSNARQGTGGINQIYAGVGTNPFKNAYVGINLSYLWGTIINDAYAYTDAGSESLFERVLQVRDFKAQIGIQYAIDITRNDRLTLGAVYSPKQSLKGKTWGAYYDVTSDAQADTVGYSSTKDRYSLPETWGGGISYQHKGFMAEVDFTYQPWEKAKSAPILNDEGETVFDKTQYDNRWKVAVGLQYMPKERGSYAQRISYRLGAFYNNDYVKVAGNSIRDYGVTMGFGLPVPKSKTMVNLGFEYHHRQATPNSLITEDYFNITLGVNFNEMWFWKNKIR